jgi:hypothetical protein
MGVAPLFREGRHTACSQVAFWLLKNSGASARSRNCRKATLSLGLRLPEFVAGLTKGFAKCDARFSSGSLRITAI